METTDQKDELRVSKLKFISRVAARSGNLIEVGDVDPVKVAAGESTRVVEVLDDNTRKIVSKIYDAMIDELLDVVSSGGSLMLTGFGRFYCLEHKGHKVRFGKDSVPNYPVLKFSASSRSIGHRLTAVPRDEDGGDRAELEDEDEGLDEEISESAESELAAS